MRGHGGSIISNGIGRISKKINGRRRRGLALLALELAFAFSFVAPVGATAAFARAKVFAFAFALAEWAKAFPSELAFALSSFSFTKVGIVLVVVIIVVLIVQRISSQHVGFVIFIIVISFIIKVPHAEFLLCRCAVPMSPRILCPISFILACKVEVETLVLRVIIDVPGAEVIGVI